MGNWREKRKMVEDMVIIGGLIGVQFVYAGNSIMMSYLMSLHLNPLTLIIFSTFATFLVLSPFSFAFERKLWPNKVSLKLLIQLVLISFSGVTLFQSLYLKGIKSTSPAMATAMPNLAPGLIFIISWAFRLEQVTLSCLYSRVKIVGTLTCVVGAVIMSIMQGANNSTMPKGSPSPMLIHDDPFSFGVFDWEKIIASSYLMAAVFVMSTNVVLQAHTLGDFPAPMTLCAATSLIGFAITLVVQLIEDHHFKSKWPAISLGDLIGYSLLAGSITGACVSFNGWAMKKRGPVLVSMFNPISAVISIILSGITFEESITIGSLAGMCLMFIGLYLVLWAKGKEGFILLNQDTLGSVYEAEKPLLG